MDDFDNSQDQTTDAEAQAGIDLKAERARRKKSAARLGWKLVGADTAEIRCERTLILGPRTIVLRGRIGVPAPDEFTAEIGEALTAPLIEPLVAKLRHTLARSAAKILRAPDDITKKHVYEHASFYSAVELAQRGMIRTFEELANKRVDEQVEMDLGLRFYLGSFPQTNRRFSYFVGPTNSGKTYAALEELRAAESGIYLAPLRLLALEVAERLRELNVPASLVTGEERVIWPGARHVSSTVEMADLGRDVDVAVLDEAQMLEDEQRGWAWTLAMAGLRARRIILCGSQDGLFAAQRLAAKLGVAIDVRTFERKNPLTVVAPASLANLQAGDAVVAFSRNNVVDLQRQISATGRSTAAIYGSLSPVVRRREAERFREGTAQVLVATDAIGLGLNLPIRRMIFATVEKFDGVSTRALRPPEVRQIAGRAGRYGLHEAGEVTALNQRDVNFLRRSLEHFEAPRDVIPIWISPTDDHLMRLSGILGTTRIARLLQFFQTRVLRDDASDLRISDLSGTIETASALEVSDIFLKLPLSTRSTYARAPVPPRGLSLAVLLRWGEQHASGQTVRGTELVNEMRARDRLLHFEDRSRLATLYLWLAQRFPDIYVNAEAVMEMREQTDLDIQSVLQQQGTREKKAPIRKPGPPRGKGPPKFNRKRLPK
jgi:ATP-dependent RNA helicase SUPV3L1/SUV3